jgi:hypothetical protein
MRAFRLRLVNRWWVEEVEGGNGLIRCGVLRLLRGVGRTEGRHGVMSEVVLREDRLPGRRLGGAGGFL